MNETDNIPADWVLLEAARVGEWEHTDGLSELRDDYKSENYATFRALCDMIAKHEQPPVDPDVEAVKRILLKFYGSPVILGEDAVARAVAQYKQERGQ